MSDGRKLEAHRFEFEGSTIGLARHLVEVHGVPGTTVARWGNGLDQGSWVALDGLHQEEHASEANGMHPKQAEAIAAGNRVKGFVRAYQLLSNQDPDVVMSVHVMGTAGPVEYNLTTADLELLVAAVTTIPEPIKTYETIRLVDGPDMPFRCADWVADDSGTTMYGRRVCGTVLQADGTCPRPKSEHYYEIEPR